MIKYYFLVIFLFSAVSNAEMYRDFETLLYVYINFYRLNFLLTFTMIPFVLSWHSRVIYNLYYNPPVYKKNTARHQKYCIFDRPFSSLCFSFCPGLMRIVFTVRVSCVFFSHFAIIRKKSMRKKGRARKVLNIKKYCKRTVFHTASHLIIHLFLPTEFVDNEKKYKSQ